MASNNMPPANNNTPAGDNTHPSVADLADMTFADATFDRDYRALCAKVDDMPLNIVALFRQTFAVAYLLRWRESPEGQSYLGIVQNTRIFLNVVVILSCWYFYPCYAVNSFRVAVVAAFIALV